jgi:uncharacterized membrane protein (DUF485 family)
MTLATDSPGRHSVAPSHEQDLFDTDEHGGRGPDFAAIRGSAEFALLRRRSRRFIFPVSALAMAWYMTFVLLAAYDHPFMSIQVLGLINMGIVLGLAQFLSTVVIMLLYCRYAKRQLDPALEAVRARAGRAS